MGRARADRSAVCPTRRWCAPAPTQAIVRVAIEEASGRRAIGGGRDPRGRPQPRAAQPAAVDAHARPARRAARHGVRARRPRAGEGGPGPPARLPRRPARVPSRRATRRRAPTTSASLRQRNALLRGGVRDDDARTTLDVFDEQLVRAGAELVRGPAAARRRGSARPSTRRTRPRRARRERVDARYEAEWAEGATPDADDVARRARAPRSNGCAAASSSGGRRSSVRTATSGGCSSTGSTRARTRRRASSARSRSRCASAGHRVVAETVGDEPVLLLDDVFSELDDQRSRRAREAPPRRPDARDDRRRAARGRRRPSVRVRVDAAARDRARRVTRLADDRRACSGRAGRPGARRRRARGGGRRPRARRSRRRRRAGRRAGRRWSGPRSRANARVRAVRGSTLTIAVERGPGRPQLRYLESEIAGARRRDRRRRRDRHRARRRARRASTGLRRSPLVE